MSQERATRLVNLTIALLTSRRYLTKQQLRSLYHKTEHWERMFERDKEELRRFGIIVETGSNDAFFDDEPGYRIRRADFELPQVEFTAAEAEALGLAARAWRQARSASYTDTALLKLRAAGVEIDHERLAELWPTMEAAEPAFDPLWAAMSAGRAVEFSYKTPDETRRVDPWSLRSRNGHWFLLGFDHARQAPRAFKLARMTSAPVAVGPSGAVRVPDDVNLRELAAKLEPSRPDQQATVFVAVGRAPQLRRRGVPAPEVAAPEGYDAIRIEYSASAVVGELAAWGPDVLVHEPAELRDRVIAALCAVAGEPAPGGEG